MGKTETLLKSEYKYITDIVYSIFNLKKEERTIENVAKLFKKQETKLIYQKLGYWYKKESISFIFNGLENIDFSEKIIGVSLKTIIEKKHLFIPIVKFLLYQIENLADGNPFILAIDNAWTVINHKEIAPQFFEALANFPLKNIAAILTTDGMDRLSDSAITTPVNNYFATELYLAIPKLNLYQKKVFSLQDEEARILALMQVKNRNFLLKCINDVIISSINLKDFGYYTKVFSNDNVSINAMYKAKENSGSDNPEVWIPVFIKIMEEYDKVLKQRKLKENEMNQLKWEEEKFAENNKNKILSGN